MALSTCEEIVLVGCEQEQDQTGVSLLMYGATAYASSLDRECGIVRTEGLCMF